MLVKLSNEFGYVFYVNPDLVSHVVETQRGVEIALADHDESLIANESIDEVIAKLSGSRPRGLVRLRQFRDVYDMSTNPATDPIRIRACTIIAISEHEHMVQGARIQASTIEGGVAEIFVMEDLDEVERLWMEALAEE